MTRKVKLWLALAFVLVFLAGAALGVFAGALHARRVFVHGPGPFAGERMRRHLQRELSLTPEQAVKIDPVIDRTAAQLETIRRETAERVSQTMNESHREIVPFLTAEQRERLERMRQRHLRMMGRRNFGPPHGPSPND